MAKDKKLPRQSGVADSWPKKAVPAAAKRLRRLIPFSEANLVVRWSHFDFDGPWCLSASDAGTIVGLFKQLTQIERMRTAEVWNGHPGKKLRSG
jgi:hypothetical protein